MPGELLEIFLKQSVTLIAGALISYLLAMLKAKQAEIRSKDEEIETLKIGVQALLRQNIINVHSQYMPVGYIPLVDKQALMLAYDSYHKLSPVNGVIDDIMDDLRSLPVKEHE